MSRHSPSPSVCPYTVACAYPGTVCSPHTPHTPQPHLPRSRADGPYRCTARSTIYQHIITAEVRSGGEGLARENISKADLWQTYASAHLTDKAHRDAGAYLPSPQARIAYEIANCRDNVANRSSGCGLEGQCDSILDVVLRPALLSVHPYLLFLSPLHHLFTNS